MLPRQFGDGRHLVHAVDQPIFGGVGDRDARRLHLVHIGTDRIEPRSDGLRRDLGAVAFQQHELGAAGIKAGGTAFVDLDMRFPVAEYALKALRHRRAGK